MKKIIYFFILLSVLSGIITAQTESNDPRIERIEKIYRNLEYNTTAFNDLKNTWNITDPYLIRDIFNRFVVKNALEVDGRKITWDELKRRAEAVHNSNVYIELRQRYYDSEIEMLRFYTEKNNSADFSRKEYIFDSVEGFIFIRDILSRDIYEKLKGRLYAHTDLTKSTFNSFLSYNFNIRMHLQKPDLMFYTITTSRMNKFMLSLNGEWGNDQLVYPGWYAPEYSAFLKLSYLNFVANNKINYTYYFKLGLGIPAKQPDFDFIEEGYSKILVPSGINIKFDLGGNPLKLIHKYFEKIHLKLEGSIALSENEAGDYKIDYATKFFSLRNFVNFYANHKNLVNVFEFGTLDAGLGFSLYNMNHYYLDPRRKEITEIDPDEHGLKTMLMADANLVNNSNLLQHKIGLQLNYDIPDSYGYFGLKVFVSITNFFGFDLGFYKSFSAGDQGLPNYRLSDYLVFSPMININY